MNVGYEKFRTYFKLDWFMAFLNEFETYRENKNISQPILYINHEIGKAFLGYEGTYLKTNFYNPIKSLTTEILNPDNDEDIAKRNESIKQQNNEIARNNEINKQKNNIIENNLTKLFNYKIWFAYYGNKTGNINSIFSQLINKGNYEGILDKNKLYFWQYTKIGDDTEIKTENNIVDLDVMCKDDFNHCPPPNSYAFKDGNSPLNMHEWEYGVKLQNCRWNKSKHFQYFSVFGSGYIVDQAFWWAYWSQGGPGKFGNPTTPAVELSNGSHCQTFERGTFLWEYPDSEYGFRFTAETNLCNLDSLMSYNSKYNCFSDVEFGYAKQICNLKAQKIVHGYSPENLIVASNTRYRATKSANTTNIYKPDQNITRAEFTKIVLLAKYSQDKIDAYQNKNYFSDIKEADWYRGYANFAKEKEILKGYDDGIFGGAKKINFAEASKIIVNTFIELTEEAKDDEWWKPFFTKLYERNISIFPPEHNVTRGEMAYLISKVKELGNAK